MYNREPTLPIDIKHNLFQNVDDDVDDNTDEPFDKKTFDAVLSNAISIREKVHKDVGENIQSAQKKQQRDYNRRHELPNVVKVGQKVLLKNQKREDRKGGKKWLGPYTVQAISKKNLCTLTNKNGKKIIKKYSISLLKPYVEDVDPTPIVNDERSPVETKIASSASMDQ